MINSNNCGNSGDRYSNIVSHSIESSILVLACNLNLLYLLELRLGEIFLGIARLLYKNSNILERLAVCLDSQLGSVSWTGNPTSANRYASNRQSAFDFDLGIQYQGGDSI